MVRWSIGDGGAVESSSGEVGEVELTELSSSATSLCVLRRGSSRGDGGWVRRQAYAFEVAAYAGGVGERCDDAHLPPACGTDADVDLKNSG